MDAPGAPLAEAGAAPSARSRRWLLPVVGAVVVVAAASLWWFQPHKLLIDERVDEAAPVAVRSATTAPATGGAGSAPGTSAPAGPADIAAGRFVSLDHRTSGDVRLVAVEGGARVVRLENFATENGPDLYVYLSANAVHGGEAAFDDDHLSLGRLKGNQGNQNYDVPDGVDLSRYRSVVIWCDRFNSAFGAASLDPT